MIGIFIELLLSWLLLRYLQKSSLAVLGLMPGGKNMLQLLLGVLWSLFFICAFQYSVSVLVHNPYQINMAYSLAKFFAATFYVLKSVFYEELAFRGALLYILIKRLGAQRGMLISAIAFGIYHWFSYGVLGNPVQMLIVFLTTGAMGYVLALGFYRTGSMWLAIGLHFGNNLARMVIFSSDKGIGEQWLLKRFVVDPFVPGPWVSIPIIVLHFVGFLVLTFFFLKYRFPKFLFKSEVVF
jgi:membrane protease YdiL (CAAX protease family)